MKKLLVLCMALVMMLSMSLSVFAAGGFVSSPAGKQSPELVEYDNESDDCVAKVDVTSLSNKEQLPEDVRKQLEDAYISIKNAEDIGVLNDEIANYAEKYDINVSDLAVSDLFNVSQSDCSNHNEHGSFNLTFKAEALQNFVCLLQHLDGKWQIVENAKVTNNGEHLEFTADKLSQFAIVVNTGKSQSVAPQTNDNGIVYVYAVVAFVSAMVAFIAVKGLKRKEEQ